ncbi:hypothetical protein PsalMR5_04798 (plasmid) [Piscirickettsia salmonis]|uniref:hypothetical protein n=1 Tax=Piscirickettsia salmonis TaxID=1238 RepID=UPI0012BAC414|nr:hypothetical protein [Piscirickettsia salmonis]QGP56862.1 hypothetical protein PsalSR1_04351 [Piscirickettsia salmonis]QGP62129.1 hypothetical protein PsalBI1_04771 [Piscirickettsia salmonis]QGP66873.1 hypothetical protein PsalMR5_04798 [Piscirickettsia salmonis]
MASKKKQIASLLTPNKAVRRSSNPVYAKLPDEKESKKDKYGIKQVDISHKEKNNKEVTKLPETTDVKRGNKGVAKSPETTDVKRGNKGVAKSPETTDVKRGNKGVAKSPETTDVKKGNKGVAKSPETTDVKRGNKGVANHLDTEKLKHGGFVSRSKTGLIGLEYRIVLALCDRCKDNSFITQALKISEIAITLGSNRATIKQSLLRLRRKGILIISEQKNGRGGWTKFAIEESIFRNLKESA